MAERTVIAVLLGFAGGGVGALIAHFAGVASWLDAKLHITLGIAAGLAIAAAMDAARRR